MGKRVLLSLLGLAGVTFSLAVGCGTVCNLAGGVIHPEDEPKVYGGMQRDLDFYSGMVDGGSSSP